MTTRSSTIENGKHFNVMNETIYDETNLYICLKVNLHEVDSYPVTGTRAADDLPPIIMLVALLVVEPVGTVGPEVTLRWALGEEGGGGRRITDTTLCVCSHIRRNRRILPEIN